LFSSDNTQLKPGCYSKDGIYYKISSSLWYGVRKEIYLGHEILGPLESVTWT